MRRLPFAAYNLGPAGDRPRRQARREIRALLRGRKAVGLLEAIGHELPWSLTHRRIHNTSTLGRANVALYVRRGLRLGKLEWVDHELDWPKVLHDGNHPARATLVQEVANWTVLVGHAPQAPRPVFGIGTNLALEAAREEWLDITVRLMRRRGPVLLLSDPNGLGDELVRRLGPHAVAGGTSTEAVHGLRVVLVAAQTPGRVGGVPMRSDHSKALIGRARRR